MLLAVSTAMVMGSMTLYAAEGAAGSNKTTPRDQDLPGFSIGYNQYYAWWGGRTWILNNRGKEGDKPANGFMYNPIIGVRFNGTYMLSASFSGGQFRYNYNFEGKALTVRYDADLLLSITLPRGFKIFFGPKYMRWEQQSTFNSIGIGFGFTYVRSLYRGLFVNASLSLIAMLDFNLFKNLPTDGTESSGKSGAFVIGTSPSLSFGYHFQNVNITLAAGCRFQVLYYSASINTRSGLTSSSMRSDYIVAPYIGLAYTY